MRDLGEDENTDHDDYFWFTGRARLSRDMHILHGYVQGIAADSTINDLEMSSLNKWLSEHREFSNLHPFNEVIPRLQQILFDGVVDEEERADLLWLSNKFSTDDGYYDDVTSEIQRLHGILAGIVSDGRINTKELKSLKAWVKDRAFLRRCWPYDSLEGKIAHVMRDGRVDHQENEALMQFFGEFVSADERRAVGVIERDVTVSGVCDMSPTIEFDGRSFCFTGSSERGSRAYVASVVKTLGGVFHKSVRSDTDFLIVGADGNPCWAYACYGRKVEEAVERRDNGQKILIVHENDFWSAADKSPDSEEANHARKLSKRKRSSQI